MLVKDVNKRLEDKELSIHLTEAAKSYVVEQDTIRYTVHVH